MNNLKISIIVPIFNSEKYLQKCIESIQSQTYKNIEIILVNDGSTDNSLDICNRFAGKDNRIFLIDEKNKGCSLARNSGLDIVTGDYIGFVDSDDYIHQDMYKQLISASLKYDADIIECGYYVVSNGYKIITPFPFKNDIINTSYECSKAFMKKENTRNFVWNKLYKKVFFRNIRFPDLKYGEDYWFNARAFYKCKRKVIISNCYYYYVINKESLTSHPFNKGSIDKIYCGKEVLDFFQDRFKDLSSFAALRIAETIIKLYRDLKDSTSQEMQKRYSDKLINEFKKYYKMIDGEAYENIRFKKRHIALLLFSINPELYCLFYKFYQKIK